MIGTHGWLIRTVRWGLQARIVIPGVKKASLGKGVGGGGDEGAGRYGFVEGSGGV